MRPQAAPRGLQSPPAPVESDVYRKVIWRLLPLMILLYFVNTLDRVNIAFAALQMNDALGFSPMVYGWGAGIFFIGYFLFEIPSNIVMHGVGARLWMARIMVTWGVLSCATAFVHTPTSFYIVRFLLGVAEAGFTPGMLLYLGMWFPRRYTARATSLFLLAAPLTTVVGAPLSGWIIQLNRAWGLAGWQWLFLIEGVPAVLLAFAVWRWLTNSPADAKWLTDSEKTALLLELELERCQITQVSERTSAWKALVNPHVLTLGAVYFFSVVGLYGIGFWLPQIVRRAGFSPLQIGLLAALPYVFASIGCLVWGRHSDLKAERRWHMVGACLLASLGLAGSAFSSGFAWSLAGLCVAAAGIYALLPVFWSVPHAFMTGAGAASGIALINSVGNLGGFLGPYLVGWLKQTTGSFQAPLYCLSGSLLMSGLIIVICLPMISSPNGTRKRPTKLSDAVVKSGHVS